MSIFVWIDIAAYPHSVNSLDLDTNDDVRTPDKLIDGENDEIDGTHCWIAPILSKFVCSFNFELNFCILTVSNVLFFLD